MFCNIKVKNVILQLCKKNATLGSVIGKFGLVTLTPLYCRQHQNILSLIIYLEQLV